MPIFLVGFITVSALLWSLKNRFLGNLLGFWNNSKLFHMQQQCQMHVQGCCKTGLEPIKYFPIWKYPDLTALLHAIVHSTAYAPHSPDQVVFWTSEPIKNTTALGLLTICISLPHRCSNQLFILGPGGAVSKLSQVVWLHLKVVGLPCGLLPCRSLSSVQQPHSWGGDDSHNKRRHQRQSERNKNHLNLAMWQSLLSPPPFHHLGTGAPNHCHSKEYFFIYRLGGRFQILLSGIG